ncbi:MAG: histidine phosphatase family protein [Erysipelotrichaceae bacterium]|nr:histidine phosphatase family protein [Erysipelotrichaceae bacterium]
MKVYIIRHGETSANKMGVFQGWTDLELNESGVFLAAETGKALKKENIRFDVCYSSPLIRAKETARLVLENSDNDCPVIYDERIKEINNGDYELAKIKGAEGEFKKFVDGWMSEGFSVGRFPNGESAEDVIKRTQEFLFELIKKDYDSVLISTHGAALRAMLNFLYEDKNYFWHTGVPYNCAVSIIESDGEDIRLLEDDKIYYDRKYVVDNYK